MILVGKCAICHKKGVVYRARWNSLIPRALCYSHLLDEMLNEMHRPRTAPQLRGVAPAAHKENTK